MEAIFDGVLRITDSVSYLDALSHNACKFAMRVMRVYTCECIGWSFCVYRSQLMQTMYISVTCAV